MSHQSPKARERAVELAKECGLFPVRRLSSGGVSSLDADGTLTAFYLAARADGIREAAETVVRFRPNVPNAADVSGSILSLIPNPEQSNG